MWVFIKLKDMSWWLFLSAGKFLPMKTMLGPRYDDKVPEENRFHPSMLSNYLKSLKVYGYPLKGIVHPKLNIQLSFTYP